MKQNREKLFFLFLDDVVNLLGSFLRGRLDLKASGLFPSIDAINLTIYSRPSHGLLAQALQVAEHDEMIALVNTQHTQYYSFLILFFLSFLLLYSTACYAVCTLVYCVYNDYHHRTCREPICLIDNSNARNEVKREFVPAIFVAVMLPSWDI